MKYKHTTHEQAHRLLWIIISEELFTASNTVLAERMGVGERQIQIYLKMLQTEGLITVQVTRFKSGPHWCGNRVIRVGAGELCQPIKK